MVDKCEYKFTKYFHPDGSINHHQADKDIKDWDEIMDAKPLHKALRGYHQLESLIRSCLCIDPKRRITCSEALKHPYFSQDLTDRKYTWPKHDQKEWWCLDRETLIAVRLFIILVY